MSSVCPLLVYLSVKLAQFPFLVGGPSLSSLSGFKSHSWDLQLLLKVTTTKKWKKRALEH